MPTATRSDDSLEALLDRGWEPTGGGRLWHGILHRYRPMPTPARSAYQHQARRLDQFRAIQSAAAVADAILEMGPVAGVAINVRRPTDHQVEQAKAILQRVPVEIRRAVFGKGGKVQLFPADDLRDVKRFSHFRRPTVGVMDGRTAVVAADRDDAALTLLHEIAHLADNLPGRHFSLSDPWRVIWRADKAAGVVPQVAGQREDATEYFAESAARYWLSPESRAELSAGVQKFMRGLPDKFRVSKQTRPGE